ncbi:MAG: hypothetical protein ACI4E1_09755 [Lachnospira sp.]
MTDNKLKGKNAIYIITLVASFIIGIRTAAEFIIYLSAYGKDDVELEAEIAMENFTYLGLFCVCIIVSFILNIVCRKYVENWMFITRTVMLVAAFLCAVCSAPAMLTCAVISLAKMEGQTEIIEKIYSSEVYSLLESSPELFYSFWAAIVIVAVLAVASFTVSQIGRHRSRNGG